MTKFKDLLLDQTFHHALPDPSVTLTLAGTDQRLFLRIDSRDVIVRASYEGHLSPWLSSLCSLLIGKSLVEARAMSWKSWETVFKDDQSFWDYRQETSDEFVFPALELLHGALDVFLGRDHLYHEMSPLICRCFGIRESDVLDHLRKNDSPTLESLTGETKAGMGCRTCVSQLRRWVSQGEEKVSRYYKHRPVSDWLVQIDQTLMAFPLARDWKMEVVGMKNQQVQVSFEKDVTQKEEEEAGKKLQEFLSSGVDTGLTFFLRRARHFSKAKG